ncbi:hypothetical protein E3P92_02867 [Wallemia ichthyophaga]|uniref:Uncharacterized protein n=1 Tax=Wallemia ichthyophaga TaxID=245174 RepID=A0A4T0GE08_WALIC|nr:hypothetical protein E3P91_02853 [Wallemia ichthyophaga]TIA80363.1 hypothetical protein E3P98_02717 [Wallemia ichthyophaga]TIA97386.1 hypothetical protein E3P95_02849 [Wallemia ichthyophaga]TIA99622.1 hypothetical protein E3P96_02873 [Wallemia ichthyophaga]TIA99881.1 hypothetical protein E3P94_02419 [Wallemia ichthyophaga]
MDKMEALKRQIRQLQLDSLSELRFIDIGLNLADSMFRGVYRSKQSHPDDLKAVVERAHRVGVDGAMLTGGNLEESVEAHNLAIQFSDFAYFSTAGLHPTRSNEFVDGYITQLEQFISDNRYRGAVRGKRVVAVGECGLDWDRLHFADKPKQIEAFTAQLQLAQRLDMPMFLHSRNCHSDLVKVIKSTCGIKLPRGCVHSFTGTVQEMHELVKMGLYIGLNGCSLKTEESIQVAKAVPLDRLMIETDAPWCGVSSTHAMHEHIDTLDDFFKLNPPLKKEKWSEEAPVKGRNEPGYLPLIAHLIACAKELPLHIVANAAHMNTNALFEL